MKLYTLLIKFLGIIKVSLIDCKLTCDQAFVRALEGLITH